MTQSRIASFLEANANTWLGFVMSMLLWEFVVKPLWGFSTSIGDNLAITTLFAVASIARGYVIRRYFNWRYNAKKSTQDKRLV